MCGAFRAGSLLGYSGVQPNPIGDARVSGKDKALEMLKIFGPPLGTAVMFFGGFYLLVELVLR
jgi:hypothetical protein